MSYYKGDLQYKSLTLIKPIDYKNPKLDETKKEFYLPHSCEEWVIGDAEDLKQFIADAQELLTLKEQLDQASV